MSQILKQRREALWVLRRWDVWLITRASVAKLNNTPWPRMPGKIPAPRSVIVCKKSPFNFWPWYATGRILKDIVIIIVDFHVLRTWHIQPSFQSLSYPVKKGLFLCQLFKGGNPDTERDSHGPTLSVYNEYQYLCLLFGHYLRERNPPPLPQAELLYSPLLGKICKRISSWLSCDLLT